MQELRRFAKFIVGLQSQDIPKSVRDSANLHILDTISAGIGASQDSLIKRIRDQLKKYQGQDGPCSVWGYGETTNLTSAIFLNAMMGHLLELDDVHTRSKTHIGTVVIPAVWGLAEQQGATGKEMQLATICGYEAMARVGAALGTISHRQHGWHVTGTAGTFGAAAACGKLLHLSEDQMVWALGLAGTQSSGLWAFLQDSANCKILHPARAATNGCEATLLAQCGMSGPESILTAADGGMLAAMSDHYNADLVCDGLGEHWAIAEMDTKPYPCCRSTHSAIDAAILLKNSYSFSIKEIQSVCVETYKIGQQQCGLSKGSLDPHTPQEAKFSTPYTVSTALLRGKVGLSDFEPAALYDPDVRSLLQKVVVHADDRFSQLYPQHWGCTLKIHLNDGRCLVQTISDASGSITNPLSEEQQIAKATQLLYYGHYDHIEGLIPNLLHTDTLSHPISI